MTDATLIRFPSIFCLVVIASYISLSTAISSFIFSRGICIIASKNDNSPVRYALSDIFLSLLIFLTKLDIIFALSTADSIRGSANLFSSVPAYKKSVSQCDKGRRPSKETACPIELTSHLMPVTAEFIYLSRLIAKSADLPISIAISSRESFL